jgi:DNA adenine methylase
MKPFLKWAGNKYQIMDRVKEVLPAGKRLIEPFVGSGAIFLNTQYPRYLLSDANLDLINLYKHLQEDGQAFIDFCRSFFTPANNAALAYYEYRACFNATTDTRLKSALFIYLNKHCFNGLCRYNSQGAFNVPFGRYAKPYFPEAEMQYFYQQAQCAIFCTANFVETMEAAELGDVVYCDPPYVPLSVTAHFTSYSTDKFGSAEQAKLVEMAALLAKRNIPVVISNHDTEFTRAAYAHAHELVYFPVQRYISCDGANRHKVAEVLAVFR